MRTVVTHPTRGNTQSNKHSLFEMATRSMGCHGHSESILTSPSSLHTVAHSINSGEGQTRRLPIHKPRRDKFSSKKKSLCHPPRPTVHGPSKRLTPTHGAAFGRCSILSMNCTGYIPGSCKTEKSGAFTDGSGEHTISHSRGVGTRKRECLCVELVDEMVGLMERIKRTISPHNLLNVRLSKGASFVCFPSLNHPLLSSCTCVRVHYPKVVLTVLGDMPGSLVCVG